MSAPDARSLVTRIAHGARDHDAYWRRPEAGWRALGRIYRDADSMARIARAKVSRAELERVVAELVAEGVLEARGEEYRHREPVTPYGGDERMRQP
jgi:hypothetical protein